MTPGPETMTPEQPHPGLHYDGAGRIVCGVCRTPVSSLEPLIGTHDPELSRARPCGHDVVNERRPDVTDDRSTRPRYREQRGIVRLTMVSGRQHTLDLDTLGPWGYDDPDLSAIAAVLQGQLDSVTSREGAVVLTMHLESVEIDPGWKAHLERQRYYERDRARAIRG